MDPHRPATKPIVAIVGRTNVGKSSLFNRLARRRLAVVHDQAGVTRDRVYAEADLDGRRVVLVDTGGLAGPVEDELFTKVREHAIAALREADVIVLVVDAQEGVVSLDHVVADVVRRSGKPVVFVANKAEKPGVDLAQFAELGFGQPLAVSAIHALGIDELVEAVLELLGEQPLEEDEAREGPIAVGIIGRPNVGKSSILNALAGEERAIVSPAPGTTRDAVDTVVQVGEEPVVLVDTAGLRRRFKRSEGVEYYAALRTLRAVERADVAALIVDGAEGPTAQDARLAGQVEEMGRGLVICVHKWDLVLARAFADQDDVDQRSALRHRRLLQADYERMLRHRIPFASHAPVLFTSVISGEGIDRILPTAVTVGRMVRKRVETAAMNRAVRQVVAEYAPPARGGRPLRVYYATQVGIRPPTVVVFVNDPELVVPTYERYMINSLRERLFGPGVPLRLIFRERPRRKAAQGSHNPQGNAPRTRT